MTETPHAGDDEALSAYLDGELAPDAAERLTERLAAEPALARRLEALRAGDAATRDAFHALDDLPLPQGVLDLLQDDVADRGHGANVVPFPVRMVRPFLQRPVAIAASLALVAGFLVSGQLAREPAGLYANTVQAGTPLYRLLETGVGAAPQALPDGGSGRVLLTFEDGAGDYCRQVAVASAATALQAVACRREGGWQLEVASYGASVQSPAGQYRQASSATPAAIGTAIDGLIGARAPLDAEAERRLVDGGWKKIGD